MDALSQYSPQDIYNAKEFGLFFKCLPSGYSDYKAQKCTDGKLSNARLTGLAAANAVGDKLPIFVVGKAEKPGCFSEVTNLPCRFRDQEKSWIDRELFEEWVREIDRYFETQGRTIALLVENCPAHPEIEGLKAINLVLLPSNAEFCIQPMDQGIIDSLKAKYRHLLVQKYVTALELRKDVDEISLLSAMSMLTSAWDMVTKATVINCFKKAGIPSYATEHALENRDDSLRDLDYDLEKLRSINPTLVPEDITGEKYVAVDENVQASAPILTDDEILSEFVPEVEQERKEDACEPHNAVLEKPSINEVRNALDTISQHSMFSRNGMEIRHHCDKLYTLIDADEKQNKQLSNEENYPMNIKTNGR